MTRPETTAPITDESANALHLARWTINSGSNVQSRGAVVISSGDHQWEAKAEGNGPVDALYRAVDQALHGVLTGHPRLVVGLQPALIGRDGAFADPAFPPALAPRLIRLIRGSSGS